MISLPVKVLLGVVGAGTASVGGVGIYYQVIAKDTKEEKTNKGNEGSDSGSSDSKNSSTGEDQSLKAKETQEVPKVEGGSEPSAVSEDSAVTIPATGKGS